MAANAHPHTFTHAGKQFTITPTWITDDPLTFTFRVEAKGSQSGKVEHYGTFRWTCEEAPYGQAFIESDVLVDNHMKSIEKAIRAKKTR